MSNTRGSIQNLSHPVVRTGEMTPNLARLDRPSRITVERTGLYRCFTEVLLHGSLRCLSGSTPATVLHSNQRRSYCPHGHSVTVGPITNGEPVDQHPSTLQGGTNVLSNIRRPELQLLDLAGLMSNAN